MNRPKVNQLKDKITNEIRKVNRDGIFVEVALEKLVSYEESMTQYELRIGDNSVAIAKKFSDEPDFRAYYVGVTSNGRNVDHKITGCSRITSILNRVTDIYLNGYTEKIVWLKRLQMELELY